MTETETKTEEKAGQRIAKERRGVVVSAKAQKTVAVEVERRSPHGRYKKYQTSQRKYQAHDELGCKEGDQVIIRETRPTSKTKRWRVIEKIAAQG
jgi:small subunit ribosomal protein S17